MANTGFRQLAEELGASRTLTKPFQQEDLLEIVIDLLD
jgi:hypothetical protein